MKSHNVWFKILSVVVIVCVLCMIIFINKKPTYEMFETKTKIITERLLEKFNVLNDNVLDVYLIPYTANVDGLWADTIGDAINDNPTQSLKREVFLLDKSEKYYTKIAMHYTPQITNKLFISVHQFDDFTTSFLNRSVELPLMYMSSFTDSGMVVEIITIATTDDSEDDEMRQIHKNMVKVIQEYLIAIQ